MSGPKKVSRAPFKRVVTTLEGQGLGLAEGRFSIAIRFSRRGAKLAFKVIWEFQPNQVAKDWIDIDELDKGIGFLTSVLFGVSGVQI